MKMLPHRNCLGLAPRGFLLALALLVLLALPLAAQDGTAGRRFVYEYRAGEKFRVLSEVEEEIFLDRRFVKRVEILNRIAFEVAEVAPDGKSGLLKGNFVTSEREKGALSYLISEEYDSEFRRDSQGYYTIDDRYYMPVVRNVPVFPDRPIAKGETWTAPGEERHDLRRGFGIPDPYAIPFEARYRYEGSVEREGRSLDLISVSYTIFYQPPAPRAYLEIYPIQIAGYSEQKVYWDSEIGQPRAYEERFKLVFDWSDGSTIEYRGSAGSRIVEAELMDRAAFKAEVEKAMKGLEGVSVESVPEGLAIRLEDIQFMPDSARLLPGELEKIGRIAELLARYPERDILVGGHTALAGTAEGRKLLSEERARTVAERIIALGARRPEAIQVAGYGAERPLADNATEAGKSRNRRVEIIILEN